MPNLLAQFQRRDFDKIIEELEETFADIQDENDRLREENNCLRDENYKDAELTRLKHQIERKEEYIDSLRESFKHGFPITDEENAKIRQWIKEHERDKHGAKDGEPLYHGAIGGGYTYKFIPTSIGVIGYIECSTCGEDFTFSDDIM